MVVFSKLSPVLLPQFQVHGAYYTAHSWVGPTIIGFKKFATSFNHTSESLGNSVERKTLPVSHYSDRKDCAVGGYKRNVEGN